jgi:hypothetical protein
MKMITKTTLELAWAQKLHAEITNTGQSWWKVSNSPNQVFEQAYMQFVNRNLSAYRFENMLLSLQEGYEWNPHLTETLQFCEYTRLLTGDKGPYGRMCVWKLPSGCELITHRDVFEYHFHIVRNIFIVSDHCSHNATIEMDDHTVDFAQGTLFQFYPAVETHSFKNKSNRDFYFLGFDCWNPYLLDLAYKTHDLEALKNHPDRLAKFGGIDNFNTKFISKH